MGIIEVVGSLIFLPRKFYNSGNVSFYTLLQDVGYLDLAEELSEATIFRALREHPECIADWRRLSEDKRTTGWYLTEPTGGKYGIGYIPVKGESPFEPLVYDNEASACAAFIKLELEDIRNSALKSKARQKRRRGK